MCSLVEPMTASAGAAKALSRASRRLEPRSASRLVPKRVLGLNLQQTGKNHRSQGVEQQAPEAIMRREMERAAQLSPDVEQTAFFVADLGEITRQHRQWTSLLPRVEPFYAIKCNPDAAVLRTLAQHGTGFDCASLEEMRQVLELGVEPSRIIFANPCKQVAHIRFAAAHGVQMMTFDNADELDKIHKHFPGAQLLLRILVDDSKSVCKFGVKFGAPLAATAMLLAKAIQLQLQVIGVSFHVGSGCYEAAAFGEAVVRARAVFDQAAALGLSLRLLDIGGGFPGARAASGLSFEAIADVLNPVINQLFPDPSVRVIAEPGRYYVHSAFTLACNITSRRVVARDVSDSTKINTLNGPPASRDDQPSYMYYVNDGVYGSFNCILFDHVQVTARPLQRAGRYVAHLSAEQLGDAEFYCSIWGPTCDSMDCLSREGVLPVMDIGDWLQFDCMGAYTMCAASEFNGFAKSRIIYTNTESPRLYKA